MQGYVIHPEHARMRIPGLVPRLDPVIDRMFAPPPAPRPYVAAAVGGLASHVGGLASHVGGLASQVASQVASHVASQVGAGVGGPGAGAGDLLARPILRAADVAAGLGLPPRLEASVTHLVRGLGSTNEVDFRRGVMTHLFEHAVDPTLRRAVLVRALDYFRRRMPDEGRTSGPLYVLERGHPRGGRYHRRVPKGDGRYAYVYDPEAYARRPDAHVDGQDVAKTRLHEAVRRVLDKNADGCPVDALSDLVLRHGKDAVLSALRTHGVRFEDGKLYQKAGEVLPAGGAVPAAGGVSPKKLAVGTRRIWHNRIVERLPDDKWHVVGHVAGLEDPKKVPPLDESALSQDELEDLVSKIRTLVAHARHKTKHKPTKHDAKTKTTDAKHDAKTTDAKTHSASP